MGTQKQALTSGDSPLPRDRFEDQALVIMRDHQVSWVEHPVADIQGSKLGLNTVELLLTGLS